MRKLKKNFRKVLSAAVAAAVLAGFAITVNAEWEQPQTYTFENMVSSEAEKPVGQGTKALIRNKESATIELDIPDISSYNYIRVLAAPKPGDINIISIGYKEEGSEEFKNIGESRITGKEALGKGGYLDIYSDWLDLSDVLETAEKVVLKVSAEDETIDDTYFTYIELANKINYPFANSEYSTDFMGYDTPHNGGVKVWGYPYPTHSNNKKEFIFKDIDLENSNELIINAVTDGTIDVKVEVNGKIFEKHEEPFEGNKDIVIPLEGISKGISDVKVSLTTDAKHDIFANYIYFTNTYVPGMEYINMGDGTDEAPKPLKQIGDGDEENDVLWIGEVKNINEEDKFGFTVTAGDLTNNAVWEGFAVDGSVRFGLVLRDVNEVGDVNTIEAEYYDSLIQ